MHKSLSLLPKGLWTRDRSCPNDNVKSAGIRLDGLGDFRHRFRVRLTLGDGHRELCGMHPKARLKEDSESAGEIGEVSNAIIPRYPYVRRRDDSSHEGRPLAALSTPRIVT